MEEGNVTEEARGKDLNKAYRQGNKQGYVGYDDDIGYGYGYKGIACCFYFISFVCVCKIENIKILKLFLALHPISIFKAHIYLLIHSDTY